MALGKRHAVVAVLVPVALLLGLSTRPWATGAGGDVLSHGPVEVSGGVAAPGAVGLAVVCAVSLLALLTGGRVIRIVSSTVMVIAAAGALLLTVTVALNPRAAVAEALARELARTSAPDATGSATAWAWAAVVVALALLVLSALGAASSRGWSGLSSRYERPSRAASGPHGQVRTAWDELTEGHDPTLRDDPGQT